MRVSIASSLLLLNIVIATRPKTLKRDVGHGNRYAYVMLAFDPPGTSPRSLWGVLPMARAIQEVSSYPLVLLTNTTHFPDGTPVKESFEKLNVQVLPVSEVPVPDAVLNEYRHQPCAEVDPPVCSYQYLKLQIWQLAQFDKLIWMDSDAILTKSIDGLFLKNGTWAQQDNWDCGSWASWIVRNTMFFNQAVDWFQRNVHLSSFQQQDRHQHQSEDPCSGLLLLEPSNSTYQDLVNYVGTLKSAPGGDQQVIADYFSKVAGHDLSLVDVSVASFGQCVGKVPTGEMPAFVHKSDWTNRCFHLGARAQECQSHPLGKYWHNHFCSAVDTIGLTEKRVVDFCHAWQLQTVGEPAAPMLRLGDFVVFVIIASLLVALVIFVRRATRPYHLKGIAYSKSDP